MFNVSYQNNLQNKIIYSNNINEYKYFEQTKYYIIILWKIKHILGNNL